MIAWCSEANALSTQMKNSFELQGLERKYISLEITILVWSSTPWAKFSRNTSQCVNWHSRSLSHMTLIVSQNKLLITNSWRQSWEIIWNSFTLKNGFLSLCPHGNSSRKLLHSFFSLHFKAEVTMEVQSQEIKSENKEEDQQRQQLTDNAFGPNPQPVLEKVEFKVCSSYYQ